MYFLHAILIFIAVLLNRIILMQTDAAQNQGRKINADLATSTNHWLKLCELQKLVHKLALRLWLRFCDTDLKDDF
jgi:hypothetical protein